MGRPDDVAVVLRARNGRNILLQTRGISPNDVKQGSKEVVVSLSQFASGTADGNNPPTQGYVSVNNGRHNAVHRLVHSVYVIGIAAPSTALFSLVRVVDSVSGQLVAACKGTDVTLDKVAKRYTEIYAGISATLNRNGHLDSATHAAESSAILKLMFPDDKKDKKQRKKSEKEAEAAAARASQQGAAGPRQRRTLVDGPKLGTTEVDPELLAVAASLPSPSPSRASSIPQSSPAMSPRKNSAGPDAWGRPTPEGSSVGGSQKNFPDSEWDAFDQAAESSASALPEPQQSAAFVDDSGFGAFGDFGASAQEQQPPPQTDGFGAFGDFGSSAQEQQQADGFGAFGDFGSAPQEQQLQPQTDGFGAFGDFGSSAQEQQQADGFGAFGDFGSTPQEQQQQPQTDGFGAFGDFGSSAQDQQQADGFGAFGDFGSTQEQQQQPQTDDFGAFGDFGSSAQEQQPPPQTDGFGDFGDFGSTPQEQQQVQQPQTDGFGAFGDFGSTAQDQQQQPQTDGFGAFGDFGSTSQADSFGDFGSAPVAPPPPAEELPAPSSSAAAAAAVPNAAAFNAFGGGFDAFGDGSFGGGDANVAAAAAEPEAEAAEPEGGSFGWGAAAAVGAGAAAVGAAAYAAVRGSKGKGADQQDKQEADAPFPGPAAAASAAATASAAPAAFFHQPPEPEGLVLVEKWEGEFVGGALSSVSVTGEVQGPQHTDTDNAPRAPQVRLQGPLARPAPPALSAALAAAKVHDQLMGGLLQGATAASGAERAILASYSIPPSAVPPPLVLKVSVASSLDRTAAAGAGAEELVVVQFAVSPKLPAALEEVIVQVELGGTGARPPAQASPAAEWCSRTGTLQWRLSAADVIPGARGALMATIEGPLQQQQSVMARASFSVRGCTLSGASCSSSSSSSSTGAPEASTPVKARCTGVVTARVGA